MKNLYTKLAVDGIKNNSKLYFPYMLSIAFGGFFYSIIVESMMQQKPLVLACHNSHRHVLGHFVERHPMVVQSNVSAIARLLSTTDEHQGSDVDGYEAVGHNGQDGRAQKEGNAPFQQFSDEFHSIRSKKMGGHNRPPMCLFTFDFGRALCPKDAY